MFFNTLSSSALLVGAVTAQQAAWAQCGGAGYSGGTTCVSGYTCVPVNQWYSQCQLGSASPAATSSVPAAVSSAAPAAPSSGTGAGAGSGKFKWLGVDESVAEWGTKFPGTAGVDYTFPSLTAIDVSTQHHKHFAFQRCTKPCRHSLPKATISSAFHSLWNVWPSALSPQRSIRAT